jgi:hypothetical protein
MWLRSERCGIVNVFKLSATCGLCTTLSAVTRVLVEVDLEKIDLEKKSS